MQDNKDLPALNVVGLLILIVANLFQLIGLASPYWVLTYTDDLGLGVVGYSGLWLKCSQMGAVHKCSGFKWEDVQVSHWFRTVQAMEVFGFGFGVVAIVLICFYIWLIRLRGKPMIRYSSLALCMFGGFLVLIAGIVFGSLKDVQLAIPMHNAATPLSWGFILSILGGILYIVSGVFFVFN